jgi:hypothetical protein
VRFHHPPEFGNEVKKVRYKQNINQKLKIQLSLRDPRLFWKEERNAELQYQLLGVTSHTPQGFVLVTREYVGLV